MDSDDGYRPSLGHFGEEIQDVTVAPRRVRPLEDLGGGLLSVEKPARYLGGEAGVMRKEGDDLLSIALCFPDLYEIGMSNNAIRILYSTLNSLDGVRAERVFAPALDFEDLLHSRRVPLYTLESGIALSDVDILGFSIGYELAATSVVAVLDSGGVPLLAEDRSDRDPIVIAGGPAVTNPHPYERFLDAAYIGEAEEEFANLCSLLSAMKREGAGRADLLRAMRHCDAMWMPARGGLPTKRARRAVSSAFPSSEARTALPLPTIRTVQDHGTVEIMRGCPNGCRFCHAGFFYRPQRVKAPLVIRSEVEHLVRCGGYREITLASLSSGDYLGIGKLLDELNAEWNPKRVSFQLPSLRVNSFTLPILSKLAEVRKSGLTFAVETPVEAWQRIINKDVAFERTVSILKEARAVGFRQAKFYFMIGLPVGAGALEESRAIAELIGRVCDRIPIQLNVNVGTFVPKPHTPFQWCAQLGEDEALDAINYLRSAVRRRRNVKLSYHSPFASLLEGIIARGDERVGGLILEAYRRGARLDAWEERFDRDLWRLVIESADWPVVTESLRARDSGEVLPWDDVSIRVSPSALRREYERALRGELTSGCAEECDHPCGSCSDKAGIDLGGLRAEEAVEASTAGIVADRLRPAYRLVIRYSRIREAAYLQHLIVIDALSRALIMLDLPLSFSEGFNPAPRLETTQPIPIAVSSRAEIASILLYEAVDPVSFIETVNERLPLGMKVEEAELFPLIEGKRQRTIGSLEWGSTYELRYRDGSAMDLYSRIAASIGERDIKGSSVSILETGGLELRLPVAARKECGLVHVLESCCELRPVQAALDIVKTRSFAKSASGELISFFDAYRNES